MAARGRHLMGQVLDTSDMPREDRERLARYGVRGAHTAEERTDLSLLMAQLPRVTVPGPDLDFEVPAISFPIAENLQAAAQKRGIALRWAHTGGASGSLHLEPPPLEEPTPDAPRAACLLWADLCREIGLEQRGGETLGRFWVDPHHPAAGAVDLSPCWRYPGSRGSLWRTWGGQYKTDPTRKKGAVEGRPATWPEGAVLPISALSPYLDQIRAEEAESADRAPRSPRRSRPPLKGAEEARSLPALAAALRAVPVEPGAAHMLRLALSRVLLERGIPQRTAASVVAIVALSLEGQEDALATVTSTAQRMESGGRCAGLPTVRRQIGAEATARLLAALHADLGLEPPPAAGMLAPRTRLRMRTARPLLDLADQQGWGVLASGLRRGLSCGRLCDREHDMSLPGEPVHSIRLMRCESMICGVCSVGRAEQIELDLRERWKGKHLHLIRMGGMTPEEATRARRRWTYGIAEKGRSRLIRVADSDGRWGWLAILEVLDEGTPRGIEPWMRARIKRWAPTASVEIEWSADSRTAAARAAAAWLSPHIMLSELREAGEHARLAATYEVWRGKRRVVGPRGDQALPWPSRDDLRARARIDAPAPLPKGQGEHRLVRASDPGEVIATSPWPWSLTRALREGGAYSLGLTRGARATATGPP